MPNPLLSRAQLAQIAQGVPKTIAGLEQLLSNVALTPATIDEANALAGSALAVAQAAMASLAALADALSELDGMPVLVPHLEVDDTAPRAHLGTMSGQNNDQIAITGGAIDGTPIGQAAASTGAFMAFGCNGKTPQTAAALGNAATDLPSAITLVNNIRAALIANGIGA